MKNEQILFTDLFDIDEIQKIQDAFALASNVASIITDRNGRPITKTSNFSQLCADIIRRTPKGRIRCKNSDEVIWQQQLKGPVMQPCLSCGLWYGGANIKVGDRHVANWIISQVRNKAVSDKEMLKFADEIGADKEEFRRALAKIPSMTSEQFEKVCNSLYLFANLLSRQAFQNMRFKKNETHMHYITSMVDSTTDFVAVADLKGRIKYINSAGLEMAGRTGQAPSSLSIQDFHPPGAAKEIMEKHLPEVMKNNTFSWKSELQHINGGIVPVSQVFMLIRNGTGKPESFGTIMRDISDIKKAEDMARLNERKYKRITENLKAEIAEREKAEEKIRRLNQELEQRIKKREGKYLIFSLAGEEYGISILRIREIIGIMPTIPVPYAPEFIKGVINLRGSIIPITDLRLKLDLEAGDYTDRTCIIVVEVVSESDNIKAQLGIIVDSVSEVLFIKGSDVEDAPAFGVGIDTDYILGMANMKEGVKVLINIDSIFSVEEIGALQKE
ncbi:MAG: PAS domain S-box protein [Desulfobulbaceae bacterium]|nr:PAS domain S-box protein [Desulfobulbaceae bacterium]